MHLIVLLDRLFILLILAIDQVESLSDDDDLNQLPHLIEPRYFFVWKLVHQIKNARCILVGNKIKKQARLVKFW